MEEDGHMFAAH